MTNCKEGDRDMERSFYTNKDIQNILHVKQTKSYEVIKELNQELKEKGFKTKEGIVNARYFNERYGLVREESDFKC